MSGDEFAKEPTSFFRVSRWFAACAKGSCFSRRCTYILRLDPPHLCHDSCEYVRTVVARHS